MVFRQADLTPCGVLFDVFKRKGGISHKELAGLLLSDRPLSDGRSASSRASDRTWLSHFIVHAPVGSLQPGYFRDWGLAAQRIMSRLRQHGPRSMTFEKIIDLVCGEGCELMCAALAACYQNVQLYRNALARFSKGQGHTTGEHAEALLVLFVAVGCSAQVRTAIDYALEYVDKNLGGRMGTPESAPVNNAEAGASGAADDVPHAIGLVRVSDGYLTGGYTLDRSGGCRCRDRRGGHWHGGYLGCRRGRVCRACERGLGCGVQPLVAARPGLDERHEAGKRSQRRGKGARFWWSGGALSR